MRWAALVLVLASSVATAQPMPPEPPGGKLFEEGRALAKQGRYAEACEIFDKSYALDPGVGTELNLADCQEHLGHLATAWRLFDDAAQRLAAQPQRQKFARDRADALASKTATVIVKVPDPAATGITVAIAGRTVKVAAEITERVDAGPVEVRITIPGKPPYDRTQNAAAGATVTFDSGVAAVSNEPVVPIAPPRDAIVTSVEERRHSRVVAAYAVAGVGAAAFVGSIAIAYVAKKNYDDAINGCAPGPSCDLMHYNDAQAAGTLADVGTVVGVVGLAAIVAGTVVYFTAPKDFVVTPTGSGHSGGVAISGTF